MSVHRIKRKKGIKLVKWKDLNETLALKYRDNKTHENIKTTKQKLNTSMK